MILGTLERAMKNRYCRSVVVMKWFSKMTTNRQWNHQRFQKTKQCLFSSFNEGSTNGDNDIKIDNKSTALTSLAEDLKQSKFRNVVALLGAGASVSAGIPDFRTKGTGLYDQLEKYNLPSPESIFDLTFYRNDPRPFVDLAKAIWPGQESGPRPTLAHSFLRLLERKQILRRCYTQNIDGLEALAGVGVDSLVECHGHFRSATCTAPGCRTPMENVDSCRDSMLQGNIPKCPKCGSPVKPDIVFFGEDLPRRFQTLVYGDVDSCDLLIVLGTSLMVMPVAAIPEWVPTNCPRLLINRELVGDFAAEELRRKGRKAMTPSRDIFLEGDCDDGVLELCGLAGWEDDLHSIHQQNR